MANLGLIFGTTYCSLSPESGIIYWSLITESVVSPFSLFCTRKDPRNLIHIYKGLLLTGEHIFTNSHYSDRKTKISAPRV